MRKLVMLGVALATTMTACQTSVKTPEATTYRHPASTQELIDGSQRVLNDISNPQVFNGGTCTAFVGKVTDYLYYLPADHFLPKNAAEVSNLKAYGEELIDTIFQIRVALHGKLQEFDGKSDLTPECVNKIREGFQYARFAEEYLLDWLYQNKVYTYKMSPIMSNKKPETWTNPKFAGFELKSGDTLLIRGKSYVSAMIARIADEEGNFSHLAIVGEDKAGKKYVVEALIQYGVIITPLDKWVQQEDARVALYRQPDAELAKKAARAIYDKAKAAIDRKQPIRYDFAMDDDDYSSIFCSEVIRYAYDIASGGSFMVPKFRSTVAKFKNTDYPTSLGVTKKTLFAPYDIEVDPRFEFVAENRHQPLLRQVRMQDAVLQSVYSWMIDKDYTYHAAVGHSVKAVFAKLVRQFGVAKDTLPKYMPVDSIKTNVQFEVVASLLEKNIYAKEKEFYEKNGFSPSFQQMLVINDEFRRQDCLKNEEYEKRHRAVTPGAPYPPGVNNSEFHWFFRGESCK